MSVRAQLTEETGIVIEGNEVILPEDKAATECLADLTKFLIKSGYLSESYFPIQSGPERYLINSEPVHRNGREMVRPKNIEGYHLECNYSVHSIKNKMMDLLQMTNFQTSADNGN